MLASVSSARAQTPAIAAGAFHTCALRQGGTVACWGRGYEGQIGRGPVTQYAGTPGAVQAVGGGGVLTGATAIAAGSTHTCAVGPGGMAACWGSGRFGQLGDGTVTEEQPTPVAVAEGGAFSVPVGGPPVATDRVRLAISFETLPTPTE